MRVILVLIVGALALPAFAGSPSPEITLPDPPEKVLESVERTAAVDDAALDVAEEVSGDPAAKEHGDQVDEPDGPPCGDGG